MPFKFDFKKTEIIKAVKRSNFFLFKFAKLLKNIFLSLFLIAFLFVGFSFFDVTSGVSSAKMLILFLSFYLLFLNLDLFTELRIKKPKIIKDINDAAINTDNYNLAEFLNFDSAKVVL